MPVEYLQLRRFSAISLSDLSERPESLWYEPPRRSEEGTSTATSNATHKRISSATAVENEPFLVDNTTTENETKTEKEQDAVSVRPFTHASECDWLPITLRLPFLISLTILSIVAGCAVLALTGYSAKHYGLGSDNSSSILFFGWRFSPTLFATIYAILVGTMLNDVRRTEIFARLSRKNGALATDTLCYPTRSWWNDPVNALSKKKNNGAHSWALLFASLVYILVLLVGSPLSAGFLSPITMQVSRDINFAGADVDPQFSWQLDSPDLMIYRTILGNLLNKSASAWVSNDYAILPFWPSEYSNAPLDASFSVEPPAQQWTGRTMAYKAETECSAMSLTDMYDQTINYTVPATLYMPERNASYDTTVLKLHSEDGCLVTVVADLFATPGWLSNGGGWWSSGPDYGSELVTGRSSINSTGTCGNRTMFFVSTPSQTNRPFSLEGHICVTSFFVADVLAAVSISESSTAVAFDPQEYIRNRKTLDPLIYNITQLEDAFLRSNWAAKLQSPLSSETSLTFGGPLLAISANEDYAGDPSLMIDSANIVPAAVKLYQRFFGEMLLLALEPSLAQNAKVKSGRITVTERRIIASSGIGITLGAILFISACCIVVVGFHTSLRRRTLNLYQDPGTIAAVASMAVSDPKVRAVFEGADSLSMSGLSKRLETASFSVNHGKLFTLDAGKVDRKNDHSVESSRKGSRDPRPAILRGWMGPLLLAFLLSLCTAIVVLYVVSRTTRLHQSAFVYQADWKILSRTSTLAPYSIIPTLFAVGVKLWFGAIMETLKRLQPYASMTKEPAPVTSSVLAAYVDVPVVLTSLKAVKNARWMLAFIGLGAIATEAFTVGMSALWDRETQSMSFSRNVSQQLELRNVPNVYNLSRAAPIIQGRYHTDDPYSSAILSSMFGVSFWGWLHGATIEITQSAPTPSWSKDTWSFVPVNVNSDNLSLGGSITVTEGSPCNVTVQTHAIRARLECAPLEYVSNTSLWLTEWDFDDRTLWNSSNKPAQLNVGYELHSGISKPFEEDFEVPIRAGPDMLTCCANVSNGIPGDAAVGYWTGSQQYFGRSRSQNAQMVAKWIVGHPLEGLYNATYNFDDPHRGSPIWVWADKPRISAVNCTPIIERANASVTVELGTGAVQRYDILETPRNAVEAWSDYYLVHADSADNTDPRFTFGGLPNESEFMNVTLSYGYLFWDILLTASDIGIVHGYVSDYPEDMDDGMFNLRMPGLNVDLMSYSMLALANNSREALLDTDTLIELANKTLGIFFKHFVSENVTSILGGQAYQPIGEKLPWDMGPVNGFAFTDANSDHNFSQGALGTENETTISPREVNVVLHVPAEQLIMAPVAVFLSVSLLAFLSLTTIVIYAFHRHDFKTLPRDVDTLAGALAFVYGSEKLLAWVDEPRKSKPWYHNMMRGSSREQKSEPVARLGPFETVDGIKRWGVELVAAAEHKDESEHGSQSQEEHMEEQRHLEP